RLEPEWGLVSRLRAVEQLLDEVDRPVAGDEGVVEDGIEARPTHLVDLPPHAFLEHGRGRVDANRGAIAANARVRNHENDRADVQALEEVDLARVAELAVVRGAQDVALERIEVEEERVV